MSEELERVPSGPPAREPSMLEAVLRAAGDPNTDADKLEKLLKIGAELERGRAESEFNLAMSALQRELPVIEKKGIVFNKAGKKQFAYARYDELHEALHPLLQAHGFNTSFNFEEPEKGRLTCILELSHTNKFQTSYSKFFRWTLPSMGENQYVTNLQNAASARSFAKRCVLIDALDILTKDTDQDGMRVPPPQPVTEEQARKIEDMLNACEEQERGATMRFKKWLKTEMKVENIRDLLQGVQRDAVMIMLKAKMEGLGIK